MASKVSQKIRRSGVSLQCKKESGADTSNPEMQNPEFTIKHHASRPYIDFDFKLHFKNGQDLDNEFEPDWEQMENIDVKSAQISLENKADRVIFKELVKEMLNKNQQFLRDIKVPYTISEQQNRDYFEGWNVEAIDEVAEAKEVFVNVNGRACAVLRLPSFKVESKQLILWAKELRLLEPASSLFIFEDIEVGIKV